MKANYVGKRFGNLIVISKTTKHVTDSLRTIGQYICLCDCGKHVVKTTAKLKSGFSLHCGCKGKLTGKIKNGKMGNKKIKK